jgi:hypothetical protein
VCPGPAAECFNPNTQVCDAGGHACDTLCGGTSCCNDGSCINDACCPDAQACGSECCATGSECIDGACCPRPCGNECCGADEFCGTDGHCAPDVDVFEIIVRATGSLSVNDPVDICGTGTALTPGGDVGLELANVPSQTGPRDRFFVGDTRADGEGRIGFDIDSSLPAFACPVEQQHLDVTVIATDRATGRETTGTFPGNYYCTNIVTPPDFNGGCF